MKVGIIPSRNHLFVWYSTHNEKSLFSLFDHQLDVVQTVNLQGNDPIEDVQMIGNGDLMYCLASTSGKSPGNYLFAVETGKGIPQSVQAIKLASPYIDPLSFQTLRLVGNNLMMMSFFESGGPYTHLTTFDERLTNHRCKSINGGLIFVAQDTDGKMIFSDVLRNQQPIANSNLTVDACMHFDDLPSLAVAFETLQSAPFSQGLAAQVNVTASAIQLDAAASPDITVVDLCPTSVNLAESTIAASHYQVGGNGINESEITIRLKDDAGNFITWGDFNVRITTTSGTLSTTSRAADGSYKATITFAPGDSSADVSFTVDNVLSPNTVHILYLDDLQLSANYHQQSPHVFLQAAGSDGTDGTAPGIHLRWMFKNKLGNEHLPKGNLASGTANFNKADDFVRIYRAPYQQQQVTLDLSKAPVLFDHANAQWMYKVNGHKYFVQFKDAIRYSNTLQSQGNPIGDTLAFIAAYGDGIIEIESRDQVAFSAELQLAGQQAGSLVKTELMAVENDLPGATKHLIARKAFNGGQLSATYQVGDNIRSVRLSATNCHVKAVDFELYSDFLAAKQAAGAWEPIGNFALTTDDEEAFQRLEPTPNTVGGKWPRFQEDCPVDIESYQTQWNGPAESDDRNFKALVQQYITLSNEANNPKANETITYVDDSSGEAITDSIEVSNLDILSIASLDYHVARMIGLGHLDLQLPNDGQQYIYMAEYVTNHDLGSNGVTLPSGDELGDLNPSGAVQHLYMTIPTGRSDQRFPFAIDLKEPYPGIWSADPAGNSITDDQGFTPSGRQRYISLRVEELTDFDRERFFENDVEFNTSESTTPVNAGISYRLDGQDWRKPDLSSESVDLPGGRTIVETIPLNIPDPNETLYVHRETQAGIHYYRGYGINWFGRITDSEVEQSIETTFPTVNRLLPPTALNALHVVEEDPLILTSRSEQERLARLSASDPTPDDLTMVRLLFEYDQKQDLISYKVSEEDEINYPDLLEKDAIFPDDDEVFAKEFDLFYRNRTPQNIRGKITRIYDDPGNEAVSVIETGVFRMSSTGSDVIPQVPSGTPAANFTGGILVIGEQRFVIQQVVETQPYPTIKVFKQAISESFQSGGNAEIGDLEAPTTTGNEIFMALENMNSQSSWGSGNPGGFTVTLPFDQIHREVILQEGLNGTQEKTLEKFRGILDNQASIVEELQPNAVDAEGNVTSTIHKGLYKITMSQPLAKHPQDIENGNAAEWSGGVVRIHTQNDSAGSRRVLRVVKADGIGDPVPLTLYVIDESFTEEEDPQTGEFYYVSEDPIQTGSNVSVNYYPGYKVYLHADTSWGLTAENLLPETGKKLKYSLFGARSIDPDQNDGGNVYSSGISTPAVMFSQRVIPAKKPEQPQAIPYATRPDSFGKSTFTFTTRYTHDPFAVQFGRGDDQGILNALYQPATINQIRQALAGQRRDLYAANRWQNLLSFDYSDNDGEFGTYPPTPDGYKFPNPDKVGLFVDGGTAGSLKPGLIKDSIKEAVLASFVPLTEIPLIYDQINGSDYRPVNKKQVVRDRNGNLLNPGDDAYDISPMAKRLGGHQVQFTDFTLDGTSSAQYFYVSREFSNTMQLGEHSEVFGPVNLINTQAPLAPQIGRVRPQLPGANFGMQQVPLQLVDVEQLVVEATQISGAATEGSAASLQMMKGNVSASFRLEENSIGAIGLSPFHANGGVANMRYAVKASAGNQLSFVHGGEETALGTFVAADSLVLQKMGSRVSVLRNEQVIHVLPGQPAEDLLLNLHLLGVDSAITGLELQTDGSYYSREILESNPAGLTMINLDNAEVDAANVFTKKSNTSDWDAGAISLEFIPYYGAVSFKAKANTAVAVGISPFNEQRTLASIDYALRTDEDGYLYVAQNGVDLSKGVAYTADSELMLERRNSLLLFKKDGRTFYQLQLSENKPYLVDFSIYSADGELRELAMHETTKVAEDYLSTEKQRPAIRLELNRYPANQKIAKVSLYRTLDPAKSASIRTMDLVKTVDLVTSGLFQENTWSIDDTFRDLEEVPYGDPIYYRLQVSREVSYMDGQSMIVTAYAPSEPSRLLVSAIVESTNPDTPIISYSIDESVVGPTGEQVSLHWDKTAYNGRYTIYQMNNQGNWLKIHELESKAPKVELKLGDTSLSTAQLQAIDGNSDSIYHHFRVDVVNAAGLSNLDKNQVTVPGHQLIEID